MKQVPEIILALREAARVRDWVWPHDHVVYPVNRYRPHVVTVEQKRGRAQLLRVIAYLESESRKAWSVVER